MLLIDAPGFTSDYFTVQLINAHYASFSNVIFMIILLKNSYVQDLRVVVLKFAKTHEYVEFFNHSLRLGIHDYWESVRN